MHPWDTPPNLARNSPLVVVGATAVLALAAGSTTAASAVTITPVPSAFAAKAGEICVDLKHALHSHPVPPAVARAIKLIPGHETKAQLKLYGNYVAKTDEPDYRRAVSRFRALGKPSAGVKAWSQFLGGFSAWVTANEQFNRLMQQGISSPAGGGSVYSKREAAYRRLRSVSTATGTRACLTPVTG